MEQGQREAGYLQFAAEHGDELAALAAALSPSRTDAQDLLSETMILLWRSWDRVARAASPRAYARRVLLNTYLRESRSQRRQRETVAMFSQEHESPPDRTSQVEQADLLDRAINSLPPRQQVAVVLHYYLDQQPAQIADELGCSVAAARTYLSRARTQLRLVLGSNAQQVNHD